MKNLQFATIPDPHAYLALTCTAYLEPHIEELNRLRSTAYFRQHPLLAYAERNWGYHARLSRCRRGSALISYLCSFLDRHTLYPASHKGPIGLEYLPSLHIAAMNGLDEVIASGVLTTPTHDQSPRHYLTPFHAAAAGGHFGAFQALLSIYGVPRGTNLWSPTRMSSNILHVAVHNNQAQFLEDLFVAVDSYGNIDAQNPFAGCNNNIQDSQGYSPLMVACRKRNGDAVRALISRRDVNVGLVDRKGLNAFYHACSDWDGLRYLFHGRYSQKETEDAAAIIVAAFPNIDAGLRDWRGVNAFMLACRRGMESVVRTLISNWSPDRVASFVSQADNQGKTALIQVLTEHLLCSAWSQAAIIRLLVEHGSDLRARETGTGMTAFLHAVLWECRHSRKVPPGEVLNVFLKVDQTVINQRDGHGRTALMLAAKAEGCHAGLVHFLLDHPGVESDYINARDNDGRSAIMYALARKHPDPFAETTVTEQPQEVMKALISHPLQDVHQHDRGGLNTCDIAFQAPWIEVIEKVHSSRHYGHYHDQFIPFLLTALKLLSTRGFNWGLHTSTLCRSVIIALGQLHDILACCLLETMHDLFGWTMDDPYTIVLLVQTTMRARARGGDGTPGCRVPLGMVLERMDVAGAPQPNVAEEMNGTPIPCTLTSPWESCSELCDADCRWHTERSDDSGDDHNYLEPETESEYMYSN